MMMMIVYGHLAAAAGRLRFPATCCFDVPKLVRVTGSTCVRLYDFGGFLVLYTVITLCTLTHNTQRNRWQVHARARVYTR